MSKEFVLHSTRIRENCSKVMTSIVRSEYFSVMNQGFSDLSKAYYIDDDRVNVDFQFEGRKLKLLEPVLYVWPDTMTDKRDGWVIMWNPDSFDPDTLKRYCEEIRPEIQKMISIIRLSKTY